MDTILLSPMTTIGLYSENKLFKPLSPNQRNYPKIITNNDPRVVMRQIKESIVYKAMLQCTSALTKHQVWYVY